MNNNFGVKSLVNNIYNPTIDKTFIQNNGVFNRAVTADNGYMCLFFNRSDVDNKLLAGDIKNLTTAKFLDVVVLDTNNNIITTINNIMGCHFNDNYLSIVGATKDTLTMWTCFIENNRIINTFKEFKVDTKISIKHNDDYISVSMNDEKFTIRNVL